jgi:hypothetical protein
MATSGTVTYSVTEADIIKDALIEIGYLDPTETPTADDIVTARRKLNLIVKQWTSQLDFAPGLKMWTRRTGYLFLQEDQTKYSLGPSGDHATETYVQTTLSTDEALGSTSLSLTSTTGMSASDNIGIVLDDGSIHWTTISGAPGAPTTIATGLASAATSGNVVFAYTTKMRRPFELLSGVLRDADGNDSPIDVNLSLQEYEAIYSKGSEGSPSRLYFEAQRTNAVAYIDCAPEDVTKVIRLPYLSYIEDFSAQANDADFPIEWARPLCLQLANDCCRPFGREPKQSLKLDLQEALTMARKAYPETAVLEYQSEPDEY